MSIEWPFTEQDVNVINSNNMKVIVELTEVKSSMEGAVPGWFSQLNVQLLVSVQVMILQFCADITEPALDSLSLSLSLCPSSKLARSLSLKINKL